MAERKFGKIWPDLNGNQTPCRSLARYLISRSGKHEICLISTQSEGKCAMRAAYSWALFAEKKFWESLTSIWLEIRFPVAHLGPYGSGRARERESDVTIAFYHKKEPNYGDRAMGWVKNPMANANRLECKLVVSGELTKRLRSCKWAGEP